MAKEFWVNLPVKDAGKSRVFFNAIGFTENTQHGNSPDMASFFIGDKNVVLMLFSEAQFKAFSANEVADTHKGSEVLFSIDAQSREEVDAMAKKVAAAGGILYGEPGEKDGWMYGCGFIDLDGHRWSILYMDFSKLQQ